MASTIRIGLHGASGRVGRCIVDACVRDDSFSLGAACASKTGGAVGVDAGVLAGVGDIGVPIGSLSQLRTDDADVWVDFSAPDATMALLDTCAAASTPVVIGTTGFSTAQRQRIGELAAKTPVVLAPNMSVGVNVVFSLLETVASVIGEDSDIEIVEAHHRHKVDAPSGTAVRMGEIVAGVLGRDLKTCAVYGREGAEGPRQRDTIGFATIRSGDIVGEHTVLFGGEGERLEITHRGSSRMNFAKGALRAARWVLGQAASVYDMRDVLNLR